MPSSSLPPVTLPGDLVSPVAGPLLRRGAPVVQRDGEVGTVLRKPAREGRWVVAFEDGVSVVVLDGNISLDLSDPAGMDLAARWLASHHGLTVGATAPMWRPTTGTLGGWVLVAGPRPRECFEVSARQPSCAQRPPGYVHGVHGVFVPALLGVTAPAASLALACLAAVGRSA